MKDFMKNINSKQLRVIVVVLALLIAFIGYEIGTIQFIDKTGAVEEENAVLEVQYNELLNKVSMQNSYDTTIKECEETMNDIKGKYGPGVTPMSSIRFSIDMEKYAQVFFSNIGFGSSTNIFSSTEVPSADGTGVYVYNNPLTISYRSSYQGLKDMMDFINSQPERMNVESISASFDSESGNLMGQMIINQYSMIGTDRIYIHPTFYDVLIGTSNIFGTLETPVKNYWNANVFGAN